MRSTHPISDVLNSHNYGDYPALSELKRCLVIKLGNIGDVLLSSPVFSCLNNFFHNSNVEINALLYQETEPILRHNKYVNHIHIVTRKEPFLKRINNEWTLFREITNKKYDLVLNMTTGDRGAILGFFSGASVRVSLDPGKKGMRGKHRLSTHFIRYPLRPRHSVERSLDFLRRIGIHPQNSERELYINPGDEGDKGIEIKLTENGVNPSGFGPIIIAPTTRWRFKSWRTDGFVELIDYLNKKYNLPVVLIGGNDIIDLEVSEEIFSQCSVKPINLTGKTSLVELAALIKKARLFVGVDSAPMHIAAALKIPTVGIFGPTNAAEWAPWDNGAGYCKVVFMREFSCLPCDLAGCANSKVSDCLVQMPASKVIDAINKVFEL